MFEKALEKNEADRDTVSIVQRGLVVDVALSEDTDLLPALAEALAKHPMSFAQNPEDAKSTLLAEEALRQRARQRPHIESGHWVHPASALTVALPDDDWGILLFGGRQIVTDDIYDPEALILSSRSQDFQDGDLRAYMEDADTLYFKNPRFAQIEAERRTVFGTEVGVVTVLVAKEKDDDLSFRFRTWIVPRSGHYFWLTALVPSDDWDDAAPVFEDIERGIRFVPAAH